MNTYDRDALKRELSVLNRKIEVEQRAAVDPAVVAAAIEQAERDRDAVTSPAVEDLREKVDALCDEIERLWGGAVHCVMNMEKLAARSDGKGKFLFPPTLAPALTSTKDERDRVLRHLDQAGIDYVRIPEIPDGPQVGTPDGKG